METEILRKGRKIPLASLIMAFLQHWGETRRQNRTFIPEGDGETSQVTKRCFYHMQWSNLEKGTRFKLQCHHSNSAWSYTYPWSLLVRRILFCKGSWANWHLISSLSLSFFFLILGFPHGLQIETLECYQEMEGFLINEFRT